jgi:imidazole glycerol-phosphate synthase subunit HisF
MIKRLSATLVLDSGLVVNSYNFKTHLPIGKLKFTLRRLQEFEIDEVVILNTSHSNTPIRDFNEILEDIDSWHIATPLAYGGGITYLKDAVEIIKAGAERVVISLKVLLDANEFFEICSYLGDQAVILHLPLEFEEGKLMVRGNSSISLKSIMGLLPDHWGGEIMFSFVANDGAKTPNWENISTALGVAIGSRNLILAGGFANAEDISQGFGFEQVSAIAVGNYLHQKELCVVNLKHNIGTEVEIRRAR